VRLAPEALARPAESLGKLWKRRDSYTSPVRFRFGTFVCDGDRRELIGNGTARPLSTKAFLLLEALIEARPNPVAHEALYQRLWPDVIVEPGNLHTLVSEIRAALGDGEHRVIRTVHRVGYAFAAAGNAEDSPRYSILLGDEEIALREGENIIGRDPRGAIVIHSAEVSRHHARLVVAGGAVTLEDLGSKNGTFLDTRRITECVAVRPGDDILVGTIRLRLVQVDAMATTATPT
jgi:DNA-binding winged helix-turn-helix (wHTH) protein